MRRIQQRRQRPGAVLILVAFCMVVFVAMIALAVDIGLLAVARNQCQNAADAAAMAGCRTMTGDAANNYNVAAIPGTAVRTVVENQILGGQVQADPATDWATTDPVQKAIVHPNDYTFVSDQVKLEIGSYTYFYNDADPSQEGFKLLIPRTNTDEPYSAVRATISYNGKYTFANAFGLNAFTTGATATAVHRPRDIVIIMDLSGSMRFQSLPGRPYSGSRTASMNPESVFPKFGHYSDTAGAALQGTVPVASGSGEYYDPCNISATTNSGPPVAEYFFQNQAGELPGTGNRAFSRAPDSYATTPGGDDYLKTAKNTGGSYAATARDVVGTSVPEIQAFQTSGYDTYLGSGQFKGYTQGPGYWGKTFFLWPPDPRGSSLDANAAANHADNGAKDWRQRFFFKVQSGTSTLQWLDQNVVLWEAGNSCRPLVPDLSNSQVTVTEGGASRTYNLRVNYAAILKWLDSDPKPFPPRLRAGRICYYDKFPDYTDTTLNQRWWTTGTDSLTDLNERFWKGYIDFVLGYVYRPAMGSLNRRNSDSYTSGTYLQSMIGNGDPYTWGSWTVSEKEPAVWRQSTAQNIYSAGATVVQVKPTSGTPAAGDFIVIDGNTYGVTGAVSRGSGKFDLTLHTALTTTLSNGEQAAIYKDYPARYMSYTDTPRRPRHHYWFGPMTLIDYLGNYNMSQFWWPGNVPEAQAWSCKVGIQTAIDDIRNNHPNDFVGMTFFSNPRTSRTGAGQHNQAVVPLGRNYTQLKDSLWFPPTTVVGGVKEITPWDADFDQVPRAKGGTAPGMGFMIAYNLFSSSATNLRFYAQPQPAYRGVAGGLGRQGASRIIIFETDGAPNTRAAASMQGNGKNSYYKIRVQYPGNLTDSRNTEWPSGGTYADSDVLDVVKQITRPETDSPPGYSTTRKKALVYAIAYGTLFDPANSTDPDQTDALDFLQTVQYYGNTAGSISGADFPADQRIYGTSAERAARMQEAFTRILQGGVQVSLIE